MSSTSFWGPGSGFGGAPCVFFLAFCTFALSLTSMIFGYSKYLLENYGETRDQFYRHFTAVFGAANVPTLCAAWYFLYQIRNVERVYTPSAFFIMELCTIFGGYIAALYALRKVGYDDIYFPMPLVTSIPMVPLLIRTLPAPGSAGALLGLPLNEHTSLYIPLLVTWTFMFDISYLVAVSVFVAIGLFVAAIGPYVMPYLYIDWLDRLLLNLFDLSYHKKKLTPRRR